MDAAGGLATLAIRPPTPPKDLNLEKAGKFTHNEPYLPSLVCRTLDTPDESPCSSTDYFSRSSERPLKRVDFLPGEAKVLTAASKSIIASQSNVRSLPPSRDCKPSKSILKPYKENPLSDPANGSSEYRQRSFPRMLEDVVRELASSSRGSRLDAYQTLNGCLKAYDDLPSPEALEEKMPLLTDFIRRDLTTGTSEGGIHDTQLMTQVLKLLTIFLWMPKLAEMLNEDFCIFVLNQSISVLTDQKSSKALVNHYMHLLATQKFHPKILTDDRANRLLNILREMTTHVKGNGVVGQRLMVYRTLLTQASMVMLRRVEEWMEHLFSGMLSNIKEVRARALAFGLDASLTLGTISHVSRSVLDIFNRQSAEGKKFSEMLVRRLSDMIGSKDEASHVPQVWSIVILFLRSRRGQLEHWEYMRMWLVILQKCFNSTDNHVKFQAHISWNRLIFAISPTISTGSSMVKMLRQPITAQLDRRHNDKQSRQAKQVAYTSYCTLLYYAFRPLSSYDTLDRFWEEYVALLLTKTDTRFACEVLMSLLGDLPQKIWSEHRANESAPVKPEELPRLDPKWVRLRAATVLKVLDAVLQSIEWQLVEDGEAWVLRAWRAFTRALGEAGSKEVKVSTESMTAVAHMMGSIKHFWVHCSKRQIACVDSLAEATDIQKLATLVDIAVYNMGPLPFTEKRLIQVSGDSFEAADTPSSRSTRIHGSLASPVAHLIRMLYVSTSAEDASECYKDTLRSFFQIALRSATSRRSKLKVLRDICDLTDSEIAESSAIKTTFWQLGLEFLTESLVSSNPDDGTNDSPYQFGPDYLAMLNMLELEAKSSTQMTKNWVAAFESINAQVQKECGIGGSVISLIEPSAVFLHTRLTKDPIEITIQRTSIVIQNTSWPESRKDIERAQRALWGASSLPFKSASFCPFDKLYTLVDNVLAATYSTCSEDVSDQIIELFQSFASFIKTSPPSQSAVLLKRLQSGCSFWIRDAGGLMNQANIPSQAIYAAVLQMWETITAVIRSLPRLDTTLSALQGLLLAGLSSRHRTIFNLSIDLWNSTFGLMSDVTYPETLRKLLLRLASITEVELQGLPVEDGSSDVDSSPFEFIETPEESEKILATGLECTETHSANELAANTPKRTDDVQVFHPSVRGSRISKTPEPGVRKQHSKLTPTPKLRHNSSQIQFATIDSSPSGAEGPESQFLTTRQREVKERQHQEAAAMFPDLRSSPRLKSRDALAKPSRLTLNSEITVQSDRLAEEVISPTLPPANAMTTTFLGSSPTPWSSGKRFGGNGYDDGPPSSPPIVSKTKPCYTLVQGGMQHYTPAGSPGKQEPEHPGREQQKSVPASAFESPLGRLVAEVEGPVIRPEGTPAQNHDQEMTDANLNSDFEVFVDAPANPCDQGLDGINESDLVNPGSIANVAADLSAAKRGSAPSIPYSSFMENSSQAAQSTVLTDPEDEVSAQIANDMEMALSQAVEGSQARSPSASSRSDSAQKRKRSPSPDRSVKRRSSPEPRGSFQVVIEKRSPVRHESDVLDCIVVASPAVEALSSAAERDTQDEIAGPSRQHHLSTSSDQLVDMPTSTDTKAHRTASRGKRGSGRKRGRPRQVSKDVALKDGSGALTPDSVPVGGSKEVGNHDDLDVKGGPGTGVGAEGASLTASLPSSSALESAAPSHLGSDGHEPVTGVSILERLKLMLEEAKAVVLSPGEGREVISAWMDLGKELHNAERRAVP
ncbi:hypothetical protein MMC30_002287 [Trapelia coarctata]|nr:hypothetical protein [Trapelia coarctata]